MWRDKVIKLDLIFILLNVNVLLFRLSMNKDVINIYEKILSKVLEDFGITEQLLFGSNDAECVQARQALIVGLADRGLSDKEIAECTRKMRRCSVCRVRNKYDDRTAPWTVRMCIERIRGK